MVHLLLASHLASFVVAQNLHQFLRQVVLPQFSSRQTVQHSTKDFTWFMRKFMRKMVIRYKTKISNYESVLLTNTIFNIGY